MKFNLLELHDPIEDQKSTELLRAYSVLPRFSKVKGGPKVEQAIKVVHFLRKINRRLRKEISPSWKEDWIKSIGYEFKQESCKDWFIGRASIPLIALEKLSQFGEEDILGLISKCSYFSSSRQAPCKIPSEIDEDLAYLVGAILGDGHIPKTSYRIRYELTEKQLVEKFVQKLEKLFEQKPAIIARNRKNKPIYQGGFGNKGVVRLFNKFLQVPRGKKSNIIKIPQIIKTADEKIKLAFLEGVYDTEGCITKNRFRVTSASKQFRDDLCELLESIGEKGRSDEWINKKYHRRYFGLRYSYSRLPFLQECRSGRPGPA